MGSHYLPLPAAILVAGVAGLFVGSFLNVVVYRTPRGLSVAGPRSFCPACNRQLTWWENVPVGSWLALRGRCRTCDQPISLRYPLVELGTGVVFALVTWGWDGTIVSAAYCVLAATMVAVSLIEYGGRRAPLLVAAIGTAIALVVIVVGSGREGNWWLVGGSLIGTTVGLVALLLLRARDPDCLDPREFRPQHPCGRRLLVRWAGGPCDGHRGSNVDRRLLLLHAGRLGDGASAICRQRRCDSPETELGSTAGGAAGISACAGHGSRPQLPRMTAPSKGP